MSGQKPNDGIKTSSQIIKCESSRANSRFYIQLNPTFAFRHDIILNHIKAFVVLFNVLVATMISTMRMSYREHIRFYVNIPFFLCKERKTAEAMAALIGWVNEQIIVDDEHPPDLEGEVTARILINKFKYFTLESWDWD